VFARERIRTTHKVMPKPSNAFGTLLGQLVVEANVYDVSGDNAALTRIPKTVEDEEIVVYDLHGKLRIVHDQNEDVLYVAWHNAASKRVVAIRLDELAARCAQACQHDPNDS